MSFFTTYTLISNMVIIATNALLSVIFHFLHSREKLFRRNLYFWLLVTLSFFIQGVTSANQALIPFAFAITLLGNIQLKTIIEEVLETKSRNDVYYYFMVIAILFSFFISNYTTSFWMISLPICLALASSLLIPSCIGLITLTKQGRLKSAITVLLIAAIIFSLHNIDFAFLRLNEDFAPYGFIIASLLCLTFGYVMPIIALEKTKMSYTIELEREVSLKTHQLQDAQAVLMQKSKLEALGTLSAGISHEINNALNYSRNALVALKKILDKSPIAEESKLKSDKAINLIEQGINLSIDIVENLKDTVRDESKNETFLLRERVLGVIALLSQKIADTSIEIDIPEEQQLHFSKVSFSQIMINLITNSVDAVSGMNGGKVLIRSYIDSKNLFLEVHDNGMGIPEAIRARIFDPFFTTKEVGKGTGLGLYIIKKELEKSGATIEYVDGGTGATFRLTFKL